MNKGIVSLIMQAENEYHDAVKKAAAEADIYAADCAKKQKAYLDEQKREWERFEKAENEALKEKLLKAERIIEKETEQKEDRLRACQEEKADSISERLKMEVLTEYGNY